MDASKVSRAASELGVSDAAARTLFSFLYMHHERNIIFDEGVPLDDVLRRLVAGIVRRLEENDAELLPALERANVMFEAWKRRDAGRVLQFLTEECVRSARTGEDVDPVLLEQIETIGGEDARRETERRCSRFERLSPEELSRRVEEIAEQARWDVIRERVSLGGEHVEGTLFPLLRDLQRSVMAVLSAAPRASSQFAERFDVDFLLERHRNGSLTRDDVGEYAAYVATMIGRLQAPVDDAIVQPWVRSVTESARSGTPLAEYLPTLVDMVREAGDHLLLVVERLRQLREAAQ